jgi:hypothetical protein
LSLLLLLSSLPLSLSLPPLSFILVLLILMLIFNLIINGEKKYKYKWYFAAPPKSRKNRWALTLTVVYP